MKLTRQEQQVVASLKAMQVKYRTLFTSKLGQEVLNDLRERFDVNRPCFQSQYGGGYCQLDAMRRDANREVILKIEELIELGKKHNTEDYVEDTD